MACLFASIATAGLIQHFNCEMNNIIDLFAFLDDRVLLSDTALSLENAITTMKLFDDACGCTCNVSKSFFGRVGATPAPAHPPYTPTLSAMKPIIGSFAYLGIDIITKHQGKRPLAKQRIANYQKRCTFLPMVPASQRHACLADAGASLWFSAGSTYTATEFKQLNTSAYKALNARGTTDGSTLLATGFTEPTRPRLQLTTL